MVALETSHVDAIFTLSLEGALERAVTHDEPTLGERPIFCIESTIPSDLQGVIRAKVFQGCPNYHSSCSGACGMQGSWSPLGAAGVVDFRSSGC